MGSIFSFCGNEKYIIHKKNNNKKNTNITNNNNNISLSSDDLHKYCKEGCNHT